MQSGPRSIAPQRPASSVPFLAGALVSCLAIVGILLRLDSFTASLWLDEYSTLWVVEGSLRQLLERVPQVMLQSPFAFMIVWFSVQLFGESEAALRLPSLLASVGAAGVLASGARWALGRRAALSAFALFWLCYPAVWTSVDARPYALALLFASVATVGLIQATAAADRIGRGLWITGGAGLVWTHYVFIPYLAGLAIACLVRPALRSTYGLRRFLFDGLLMSCLVLPTVPRLLSAVPSPASRDWLFEPRHLGLVALLIPFLVPALLSPGRLSARERDWRLALWAAAIVQIISLQLSAVAGGPIATRYAVVVIVPLVLLAAFNVARARGHERLVAVSWFALTTGVAFYANVRLFGSPSGAGYQQWREAVHAIEADPHHRPDVPVLFRSGNAEDDAGLPGPPGWPATLAPLRAPGERAPGWNVLLLTYGWAHPDRARYFAEVLAPKLENEPIFYLLCLVSDEPRTRGYCADVGAWIEATWPGHVRAVPLGRFSQIEAVRFDREAPPANQPSDPKGRIGAISNPQ